MTLVTLIGLMAATGSASVGTADADSARVSESSSRRPQGEGGPVRGARTCKAARRAAKFYAGRVAYWYDKMGVGFQTRRLAACPRYLARVLRQKAKIARLKYLVWLDYHWNWQRWLPDKWARIGACETGYGRRPGQWTWNSGVYQGAFGFHHSSWDAFVRYADRRAGPYPSEAYLATPRQQYEVALAIWRRYGFSGWGCRNA